MLKGYFYLSQAFAASKFADACLRGMRGDANVVVCAFVDSQVCYSWSVNFFSSTLLFNFLYAWENEYNFSPCQVTELPFFASKVRLGRNGVEEVYSLGLLNEYERSDKIKILLRFLSIISFFLSYDCARVYNMTTQHIHEVGLGQSYSIKFCTNPPRWLLSQQGFRKKAWLSCFLLCLLILQWSMVWFIASISIVNGNA